MDKNRSLIELSERLDFMDGNFSAQDSRQKVFSSIWALEGQVNSGGFQSFFEYEDPALVAYAPTALREIGANQCAQIVEQAISVAHPEQHDAGERLDALDTEFYAYPDDLTALLYRFVSENQDTFGPLPGEARQVAGGGGGDA